MIETHWNRSTVGVLVLAAALASPAAGQAAGQEWARQEAAGREVTGSVPAEVSRFALTRAVLEASAQVATKPAKSSAESDWGRVIRLEPGTNVLLTVAGGNSVPVKLLAADESGLELMKPAESKLPDDVERALLTLAARLPDVRRGLDMSVNDTRLSRDGIFRGEVKLAELDQAIERVDRTNVVEVALPRVKTRAGRGALIGVLGGLGAGMVAGAITKDPDIAGGVGGAVMIFGTLGGAIIGAMKERPAEPKIVYTTR